MNTYYDKFGRLHDKPVTDTNPYPCNNSFLYSGEAAVLGVKIDSRQVIDCFDDECSVRYGFNRNPGGGIFPLSSHDEIVGLFMLGKDRHYIYGNLERQYFQVCNLPDFKPTQLHKLNPIKVAFDFWRLSREENPRKATHKYPYIAPIVFRHAPQHTYFYARCASRETGIIHSLYFFIASMFTIFGSNNSSKVMLGFKLLKLKQLNYTLLEKLAAKIYNLKLNFREEVKVYFPEGHPIRMKLFFDKYKDKKVVSP